MLLNQALESGAVDQLKLPGVLSINGVIFSMSVHSSHPLSPPISGHPAVSRGLGNDVSLSPESHASNESIEHEISELTWAVLDGRATSEQRRRLSELVSSQHRNRPQAEE